MPTRYWIALTAALVLLAGGVAFCFQTRRAVMASIREVIAGVERTPENAETLAAADRSLESGAVLADFGMQVPPSLLWRINLADALQTFWPAWIAFVFGVCFGVAWLTRGRPAVESPQS